MISDETLDDKCIGGHIYCEEKLILSQILRDETVLEKEIAGAEEDWKSVGENYRNSIENLNEIELCRGVYCISKGILAKKKYSLRTAAQMKGIEILKYLKSSDAGYDIGWRNANGIWIMDGYNDKFRLIFPKETKKITAEEVSNLRTTVERHYAFNRTLEKSRYEIMPEEPRMVA